MVVERRPAVHAGARRQGRVRGRWYHPGMKLDIVLWPDPVLLEGPLPVAEVDAARRQVVEEMRPGMFGLKGVGLAAPQVGVAKRVMLVCPTGHPGDEVVVLNPRIVEKVGTELGEEGCLSFPDIYGTVKRAVQILVRYQDLDLRDREMPLDGFVARIFQHELDHLDGKVFIDEMEPESREKVQDRLDQLRAEFAA